MPRCRWSSPLRFWDDQKFCHTTKSADARMNSETSPGPDFSRMTGNPGMILARCLQKSDKFAVPGMNLPECMVRRRTAREKCLEEESLRQCIRPFCGELFLLAMMRYAACCPQKPLGHVRAHSVNRFQARRSDCSFIFTRPMQTLVGELGSIFCYVCLCRCSAGSRFVILTT